MRVLIVLSALTGLSQATAVVPRQSISPSEVILTSTSVSTVTNTIITAYPVITTATTCSVGTTIPIETGCTPGAVFSLPGGNYYSQACSVSLSGGTIIRAYVEPAGQAAKSVCASFCNVLNNLKTAASSCNGIVYTTIGALNQCFLKNGPVTAVSAEASVFAVQQFTENPCIATITASTTDTSYQTVTSTYEIVYTSTITPSAAATTSIVTPSAAATTSSFEIPSAATSINVNKD
ncbi:d3a6b985-da10-43e2-9ce4-6a6bfccb26ee [Sclerotinia trifoliorum]|uniref:D3a6b985-da10-43e2-9ce4-6a6bfccb26ee n=1 Tax=Sclerotinia trifoliorum TaxID=28548 RepID=A0A8H2VRX9_9HELO|nr:d3a6b985-da10-43e2-9ce4-6a6bfccb26ee [Sclerotinia trifoliorum]